jgi:small subunit ribosomal protein S1
MVNNHSLKAYKELNGGPPPLDESWWEAVLAEEEAQKPPVPGRRHSSSAPSSRPSRDQDDQALIDGLSKADSSAKVDWKLAKDLFERDEVVCLQVTGYNRGGLLVSGEGLQGFVPISHLVEMPGNRSEDEQEELLAEYLDRVLQIKVIECDQERGRVVFSERAALSRSGSRNILLTQLKPGDCVQGTVTNITDFGVFVDLGGIEGLVHVSEISWGRVRHPSDVVRLGQLIRIYVINVDQERSRVGLSMKRLRPNPWETAQERYHVGQVTEVVITSIVSFGAFARLEEGLDGLIHVSEIHGESGEGSTPLDSLYEGQVLKVRILHVDASRQRLGLSLNTED